MKTILSMLSDGAGNTSSSRFIMIYTVVFITVMKFWNSHLTKQSITIDPSDLTLLGMVFGLKAVTTHQENASDKISASSGLDLATAATPLRSVILGEAPAAPVATVTVVK